MNRRQALAALAAVPFAARLAAQTRADDPAPGGHLVQSWIHPRTGRPSQDVEERPGARTSRAGPQHARSGTQPACRHAHALHRAWPDRRGRGGAGTALHSRCVRTAASSRGGQTDEAFSGPRHSRNSRNAPSREPAPNTPTPLAVPFDAVDVVCAGDHALARARDGSV